MKSRRRSLAGPTLVVALGLCVAAPPLAAQDPPLGQIALPSSAIVVDMDTATIRITAADIGEPEVRWWRERPDDPGLDELSVTVDTGRVVIERPAGGEGATLARLLVEVAISSDQALRVAGTALDLTIEREVISQAQPSDPDIPPAHVTPALVELELEDSRALLVGPGAVTASFDRSSVSLRTTNGLHEIEAFESELRFFSHAGNITLTAQGVDVVTEDLKGQFSYQGDGGSIELNSSQGRFNIRADRAQVQLLDWGGTGMASVTDSNIDLRDSVFQSLNLGAFSSHSAVSRCQGTISVDLDGGSLTADDLSGKFTGTVRNSASLELTGHQGDVSLNLQQDASAELSAVSGDVIVTSNGARLTVDDAASLTLTADESWANLSAISDLKTFQVTRSEIDLDLSQSPDRNPMVSVQAESSVRIFLGSPCRVQSTGGNASLTSRIDVTGCEVRVGQGRKWVSGTVRGIDGRLPVTLTAQVAEDAELVVSGQP